MASLGTGTPVNRAVAGKTADFDVSTVTCKSYKTSVVEGGFRDKWG